MIMTDYVPYYTYLGDTVPGVHVIGREAQANCLCRIVEEATRTTLEMTSKDGMSAFC